jgi:RHS repeat-associated protein
VVEGATIVESYDFEPWGLLMPGRTLGSGTKEGFTDKERDLETGLDYFGARYYMPALARWGSVDPLAEKHLEWSPYNYVLNNPLGLIDPDGRQVSAQLIRLQEQFRPVGDAFAGVGDFVTRTGGGLWRAVTNPVDAVAAWSALTFAPGDRGRDTRQDFFLDMVREPIQRWQDGGVRGKADAITEGLVLALPAVSTYVRSTSRVAAVTVADNAALDGSFSIIDWTGYPTNLPRPAGPFRILEGGEYAAARRAANRANQAMHQADPSIAGMDIHEIHPVKFGGSPTDPSNKIVLRRPDHVPATTWWNQFLRDLRGNQ